MKLRQGTAANGFALRKTRNLNKAFELVKGILHNSRPEFNYYLQPTVRGRNYILKKHGNLKGFAVLGPNKGNRTVWLELIATEPGKGYGSILMNRIKTNALSRGMGGIIIHDPVAPARRFYQSLGAELIPKNNSANTTKMFMTTMTKRKRSPSPQSRRQPTPNRQRSPSHPSPKRRASSSASSPRRSALRQTPRH